jgi:heme/copper-type cytochrome/quinol oxidase subunit 4
MANEKEYRESSKAIYFAIYVITLAITGLQIVLAYHQSSVGHHVFQMLSLAAIQAGLGVLFFMHLWQEKRAMMLVMVPITLFVLFMMNMIWTDSFRMLNLRPF